MLQYIIDGYNIVHKIPEIKTAPIPQKALIDYIKRHRLTGSVRNKVTVVFDGYPVPSLPQEVDYTIIFSCEQSADDYIQRYLQKFSQRSEMIVVSDDRQIRDFVRQLGARSLRVNEFITKKEKKTQSEAIVEKNIDASLKHQITEEMKRIWSDI